MTQFLIAQWFMSYCIFYFGCLATYCLFYFIQSSLIFPSWFIFVCFKRRFKWESIIINYFNINEENGGNICILVAQTLSIWLLLRLFLGTFRVVECNYCVRVTDKNFTEVIKQKGAQLGVLHRQHRASRGQEVSKRQKSNACAKVMCWNVALQCNKSRLSGNSSDRA